MRSSILEARTGMLIANRATAATIKATRTIAFIFIVLSPFYFCVSDALLPHDLLDLADLFLYFAGPVFVLTFAFQIGIHADFPGNLLDLALHFVKLAFRLVLRDGFHGVPPVGSRFDAWAILFRRQGAGSIQNLF